MAALLAGINHVALLTENLDRFLAFYTSVFGATVTFDLEEDGLRHALVDIGGGTALHPFEVAGNRHGRGLPEMFDRGHLDHVALAAADAAAFEKLRDRLAEVGASDGSVTDFGVVRTVWFSDPDGLEGEVALWSNGVPRTFEDRIVERYTPTPA